jgi:hypothetical protein
MKTWVLEKEGLFIMTRLTLLVTNDPHSKYTFIIINNYFSNTTTTTNFTGIEDGKGEREIPCRSKQINMKNTEKVM